MLSEYCDLGLPFKFLEGRPCVQAEFGGLESCRKDEGSEVFWRAAADRYQPSALI